MLGGVSAFLESICMLFAVQVLTSSLDQCIYKLVFPSVNFTIWCYYWRLFWYELYCFWIFKQVCFYVIENGSNIRKVLLYFTSVFVRSYVTNGFLGCVTMTVKSGVFSEVIFFLVHRSKPIGHLQSDLYWTSVRQIYFMDACTVVVNVGRSLSI